MGGDSLSVPILYEANATDFNNLGLGPLVDTTVATVTEERNGQFILEMQYPVDGIRASLIAKNRILKVDAGHKLKDQRFVIKRINRIMGNDGLSYSIYAEHISYITADYALKPNLTVSGSGNVAMTQWLNGIIDSNRIHVDSDITTENTTNWTIDKVQNARQALGGVQGSILDVWGGEYRFDNLNISLLRHRGTVSNTMLSYGRNITDFDQEENITNTYTSIYPFASYSVQNGDTSDQKILTIPDLVVDSEYVNNFPNRKIQVVDFSDKFSTDEKPTVERLAELAKSYIKNNNVGVPTVSTKISFVDLSKTENYKEFAPLEELDLCDEVPFAFEKFGIKTTAKISRIVWNVLLDSYDSLELGELKTNLSDVINNTNNAALDAKDAANDAKNSADNAALSANGKNRNWYGADDPAFGHLSELRDGDSWYMPNGEDTELYHWINGQWVFILSTKDTHEAKDAADTAQKEAEEAKNQANKAVDGANDAVSKAGFANDAATQAKSDAAEAGQQAKDALTSAKKALTDSGSAMVDSAQARKDSATAIKDAADSLTSAKDAISKVGSLTTSVTSQFTTVNNELKSKVNQTDYDKLKGTVTSQQTEINQNASGIKLKADTTALNELKGTVDKQGSEITLNTNSIKLKADQSSVDTLKGTVDKQGSAIDVNTKAIALKASQSTVDTLTGRVSTAEGKITVQADQISQTVSKTELTSKLNGYATQTWSEGKISAAKDEIKASVETVKQTVDNWRVGGTNLAPGTSADWQKVSVPSGWGTTYLSNQIYEIKDGETYTLQVEVRNITSPIMLEPYCYTAVGAGDGLLAPAQEADKDGKIIITFTANLPEGYAYFRPDLAFTSSLTGAGSYEYRRFKLETGTMATDWSPAPEDQATVDWTKSQLDITDKKITAGITTVTNTLNNNIASATANMATTTWTNTQIDAAKTAINLSVEQSITTTKNTLNNNIANATNDMATKTWTKGQLDLTDSSLTSQISSVKDGLTTQYTQLQQTLNGVQITANNAVTQGQLTLLNDQFTSTISGVKADLNNMNVGGRNLIHDTSFEQGLWKTVWNKPSISITADGNLKFIIPDTSQAGIGVSAETLEMDKIYTLTAKVRGLGKFQPYIMYGGDIGNFDLYDSNGVPYQMINSDTDFVDIKYTFTLRGKDPMKQYAFAVLTMGAAGNWLEIKKDSLKLEAGNVSTAWTPAPEDQATVADVSSQFTQLQNDINLRVKAGDVVNQINISPEGILIDGQKVHITGQTSIDNAVIKDAMIANVTADKITAGTLNAANVNVINLNANNITTGTIKGANLSLNLNTGEVLFQKGSIKSSDGTFAVDIDNRIITSTDDSHNGIVLKHGELHFYKEINAGSGSAEFGRMDVAYLNGGGLNITGYNGLTLGTEFTGLYEAHLALVSPKYNLGKSSAALVGDVIYLQSSLGKAEIIISGKTDISGSTSVIGDFDVLGKKNAIHLTNDGIRETPAYETAESYLGDIGEGVTDESGRALIHIDALFNQIINTDYDYQVFVSSYSNAIVWVEEREKASFEIHSNISNAKFAWEIKAKRRGYETDRLVKSEMKYERLNKFHEKKVSA